MIRFDHVTITYPAAASPALREVDITIDEGELVVVTGRTGSGKSTLLRAVNGLVPHFSGGTLHGTVSVAGRSTAEHPPRELADLVGFVPQNPVESFVTDTVEQEIAYAMENLGFDPVVMRRRVEETLDLLSIADLRERQLTELSGGQQQRVAIASVLSPSPRVLVLDEPTSSLDPAAAEEVLAAVSRLVHDVGLTVVMAEHRLERVAPFADRVAVVDDGRVRVAPPGEAFASSPVSPPVVELGRRLDWSPLPLTVRDARRAAVDLRERLHLVEPPPAVRSTGQAVSVDGTSTSLIDVSALHVRYGPTVALDGVTFAVGGGEIVALMGRNGSGKTSLLSALAGVIDPRAGDVAVAGSDPAALSAADRIRHVGFVPQDPSILLYADSVEAECEASDREGGLAAGTTERLVSELVGDLDGRTHPRDLSEGQRLGVAIALVAAFEPKVLLLDEPTRGLDYQAKDHLVALLRSISASGTTVVVATHDVELAAAVSERTVVLADGEVIADGPTREVVCQSTVFAPQVAKVMAPEQWLTVDEVIGALEAADR